jgi:ATP-dependent DNA helicase RecQ
MKELSTWKQASLAAADTLFAAIARKDQLEAVCLLHKNRGMLNIQPTSWGKTHTAVAAALAVSRSTTPLTVAVYPTLALMRDQLPKFANAGLRCAAWSSDNSFEHQMLAKSIIDGGVDVILLMPERLHTDLFAKVSTKVRNNVGLLIVDEAHLIHSWGIGFREDFLHLKQARQEFRNARVLASTATAGDGVEAVIADVLGRLHVNRGDLRREDITLKRLPTAEFHIQAAWAKKIVEHQTGTCLIFTTTKSEADKLAAFLREFSIDARPYHSGIPADVKAATERALAEGTVEAVVSTSSLGMGVDYPAVTCTINLGLPPTLEELMQRTGRCGRAGRKGIAWLLPREDAYTDWGRIDGYDYNPTAEAHVRSLLVGGVASMAELKAAAGRHSGTSEASHIIARAHTLGLVATSGDSVVLLEADWSALDEYGKQIKAAIESGKHLVIGVANTTECLERAITAPLGQTSGEPCGRCSTCSPGIQVPAPAQVLIDAAKEALFRKRASSLPRRTASSINPRGRWR